jgi:hypothetical protein
MLKEEIKRLRNLIQFLDDSLVDEYEVLTPGNKSSCLDLIKRSVDLLNLIQNTV